MGRLWPVPTFPTRGDGHCRPGRAASGWGPTTSSCSPLTPTASTVGTLARSTAPTSWGLPCRSGCAKHRRLARLPLLEFFERRVQMCQGAHHLPAQSRQVADRIVLAAQEVQVETPGDERFERLIAEPAGGARRLQHLIAQALAVEYHLSLRREMNGKKRGGKDRPLHDLRRQRDLDPAGPARAPEPRDIYLGGKAAVTRLPPLEER